MINHQNDRYAIIGAGNIGRMLVHRLLAGGVPNEHLKICDSDPDKAGRIAQEHGIRAFSLPDTQCAANIWLHATPPKAIVPVLQSLTTYLQPGDIVISFAAAVPLALMEKVTPPGVQAVRIMPSMTSYVGKGVNPVCFGQTVSPQARRKVVSLLMALGDYIEIQDDQMNWCVGLTGASMRAILPMMEGMVNAGIEAGLSRADARRVAAQMLTGTAALVLETDFPFDALKAMTPMEVVDEQALANIFYQSVRQAKERIDTLQGRITGS